LINAKIIKHSINPANEDIVTWELEYHRFIHAEFMTHRDFSRNASSSRAIPIWKMIKHAWTNMAIPTHWGKKQKGMQAAQEVNPFAQTMGKIIWIFTGLCVSLMVLLMKGLGVHKQVANRMLEPWTHIKVVMTTTKHGNWFLLRDHRDAQPEIRQLAKQMRQKLAESTPERLEWGEWHLPYLTSYDKSILTLSKQLKVSTSCCAQVSYRLLDTSVAKAIAIFNRLVNADVKHASPFEHPAQAVENGGTGNFTGTGWMQYRKLLEDGLVEVEMDEDC